MYVCGSVISLAIQVQSQQYLFHFNKKNGKILIVIKSIHLLLDYFYFISHCFVFFYCNGKISIVCIRFHLDIITDC